MTIFFFSHAHEQIERENKNKARKKDSFPHFRARASVKISTPRKTNFSFTFQKTKSHVKLPFSKQLEVFFGGGTMAGQQCLHLHWLHNTWEKFYVKSYVVDFLGNHSGQKCRKKFNFLQ